MKRYLGLDETELQENEEMWLEEQGQVPEAAASDVGLRSVGISPGGIASDLDTMAEVPGIEGTEAGAAPGTEPGAVPGAAPVAGAGLASPISGAAATPPAAAPAV